MLTVLDLVKRLELRPLKELQSAFRDVHLQRLNRKISYCNEGPVRQKLLSICLHIRRRWYTQIGHQGPGQCTEGLQVKVWVDGSNVNIEGAIPVGEDDVESATPRCSE